MIFIVIGAFVVIGTVVAIVKSEKSLKHILAEARYELIYNIIGSKSLLEDFLMRNKNKTELVDKTGRTAVITGGTRGIGVEVIRILMECNIDVIMGCRKVEAAEPILKAIREKGVEKGSLKAFQLDTSSLKSVESFAKVITENCTGINYLINNAGIMYVPYSESPEGFESQFATNYLGHFYLTHLLLPLLKKTGKPDEHARIVNVTSCAYLTGEINFDDINKKDMFISFENYSQSKLAQLLSSNYINEMLEKDGANVNSFAVHPGIVNTDIFDDTLTKNVFWWLLPYIFKEPEEGAFPIVHACISRNLEQKGGSYISNCKIQTQKPFALDKEIQKKLFEFTLKITKVTTFGKA